MDTDNTQGGAEPYPAPDGSHGGAVAWAVCTPENWGLETPCFFCEQKARDHASTITGMKNIVKLYRQPALTDAERFVLREVRDIYANEDDVKCNEIAAVLDGLLERTK